MLVLDSGFLVSSRATKFDTKIFHLSAIFQNDYVFSLRRFKLKAAQCDHSHSLFEKIFLCVLNYHLEFFDNGSSKVYFRN